MQKRVDSYAGLLPFCNVYSNIVISPYSCTVWSANAVLQAMFPSKGKILAIAVSWFTQFVLIYNFIRLRFHSPPITAMSETLPTHHGEPLSCVELPVMSHILVPRD
jgi:hypothetical protein